MSSFCVFCLRNKVSYGNLTGKCKNIVAKFLKLLHRFVGEDKDGRLDEFRLCLLECCEECVFIVNSFCDVYHQFKCFELQLECTIWKLVQIMRLANKVPSRVSQVKKILHDNSGTTEVEVLRRNIILKCEHKLRRRRPRILLQRTDPKTSIIKINKTLSVSTSFSVDVSKVPTKIQTDGNNASPGTNIEDTFDTLDNDEHTDIEVNIINDRFNEIDNNTSTNNNSDKELAINSIPLTSPSMKFGNIVMENSLVCMADDQKKNDEICVAALGNNEVTRTCNNEEVKTKLRYNLRAKKSQKYCDELSDKNNAHTHTKQKIRIFKKFPNSTEINNRDSFSETTSESGEDESYFKIKPKTLTTLKNGKPVYNCGANWCNKRFRQVKSYMDHMKLHEFGKFPCSFCKILQSSLVKLSLHEYQLHGVIPIKTEEKTENVKSKPGKFRRTIKCPRCSYTALYRFQYIQHFAYVHFGVGDKPIEAVSKKRISCEICRKKVSLNLKNQHMLVWHGVANDVTIKTEENEDQNIHKCTRNECSAYFIEKNQLKSHCKYQHEYKACQITQCHICLKKFSNRLQLQKHKRLVHKNQRISLATYLQYHKNGNSNEVKHFQTLNQTRTSGDIYKCEFCQEVKENPADLALHEAEMHSPTNTGKSKYTCPRCPFTCNLIGYYVKHHLNEHLKILNSNSATACKLCSVGSSYVENNLQHFKKFHQVDSEMMEAQKCDKCEAYFRKPFQLQMHKIKMHFQDNRCEICGKIYKQRRGLLGHYKIMHPLKDTNPDLPFVCEIKAECKKRFGTKAEWDHHQKYSHLNQSDRARKTKDNYKKCDKCEKEFTCQTNLQHHLVKVHGDRPFVCDECGKAFGSKRTLEFHSDFHKGPDEWKWQCTECGKKCSSKQKLEDHGRTHTKEKPFVCHFCGEKYAHRHNWRNHLKTKHGDEDGVEKLIGKGKKGDYVKRKGSKKGECIIATK